MIDYFVTEVEYGTPEYHETILLRDDILRKPLNLKFTPQQLSLEYDSFHLAMYDQHLRMVGCLVLKPLSDKVIKMRQVAIAKAFQGRGLGSKLVRFSEVFSISKNFEMIELNARDTAVSFYQNQEYMKIGDPFTEVGIKHYKMTKQLL